MATRLPLVLDDSLSMERLQPGDTLSVEDRMDNLELRLSGLIEFLRFNGIEIPEGLGE